MMKLMKKLKIQFAILLAVFLFSCQIDEPVNPNQPNLYGPGGVIENPTRGKLNELVIGVLASTSTQMGVYYDVAGVIGRDIYRFDTADPRYVGDLMGTGNLDNSAFYSNNSYGQRYATVKTCNVMIEVAPRTPGLSAAEIEGYLAYAKTMKAFELLNALNHVYNNGIRINVEDEDNLGPFTANAADALTAIAGVLAEAADHNADAGATFPFTLTSGFNMSPDAGDEFNTPATFGEFIKALQARVELYRGNYAQALTFVNQSFIDETGNFELGVYRVFSTAAGDRTNPLFFARNTNGTTRVAHPSWIADAIPGDERLNKAVLRTTPITPAGSGLTGTHDAFLYTSNTAPIAMIRNEELILIKAEALVQTNQFADAKVLIDLIRVDVADIGTYGGALAQPDMIDEVLFQRRYSLWDEGHRWIDMRRYDRLDELTIDRVGDSVIEQMPRPFNEIGVQGG
jgi:starch-binding outer membrane protein, SusD/RagB family